MKPTVSCLVHYQAYGTPGGEFASIPRAAVITEVRRKDDSEFDDDIVPGDNNEDRYEVHVCVLNPSGIFFNKVPYSAVPKPGCWNWPPREEV